MDIYMHSLARPAITTGGSDFLTTRHLYTGIMIVHLCVGGRKASSRLVSQGRS